MATTIEVRRMMAGTPERVYELIADVTRMAEWSPESAGAEWLTGEPGTTGSTFRGDNRRSWTKWSTTCTVIAADPGERFAFTVSANGRLTAVWEFEIARRPVGCEVVERTVDRRDRFYKMFGFVTVGFGRRSNRNRRTMQQTLDALARAVER